MNADRHIVNVSQEVFLKITKRARYGDSVDSILRRLLGMKTGKRRGPKKKR